MATDSPAEFDSKGLPGESTLPEEAGVRPGSDQCAVFGCLLVISQHACDQSCGVCLSVCEQIKCLLAQLLLRSDDSE